MTTLSAHRILALEPYFGGSHEAFLKGWTQRSRHTWTLLTLPPRKWKWRMRHAAITFAEQVRERWDQGERWDVLFCSDMLNLAEFLGLAPSGCRTLPVLAYFHENQLTYPVEHEKEYDYHFAFSNLTTALAATEVWFNSAYHRDSFLTELTSFLRRMPDHQPLNAVETIRTHTYIEPPGIDAPPPRGPRNTGPLRILWAARWEYDKDPETFFRALELLQKENVPFELSVIGGDNRNELPVFTHARERFHDCIRHWGFLPSRKDYSAALQETDVVVSTAQHEFFGIAVAEAVAAGAFPLVPKRLAYPEVLNDPAFFYDGTAKHLARKLEHAAARIETAALWEGDPLRGRRCIERFFWDPRVPEWDTRLASLTRAVTDSRPAAETPRH